MITNSFEFSVLLSVYKNEQAEFLSSALSSIWHDQSLKPDQIVLVKDGVLTPELEAVLSSWQTELGEVLTLVPLPHNVGLAVALNSGLQYCKHDLVARMDTDDIASSERFDLQLTFMQSNPDIAISSGFIEEWNSDMSKKLSCRILPLEHEAIVKFAKLRSPISHAACIFRKSVISSLGGYTNIYPEDHLLWVRAIQAGFKLANIPKVLLHMRTGENFVTRRGYKFLKGELSSYYIMYKSGFLSLSHFFRVSFLRSLVRLSPNFIKLWLYKSFR